MNGEIIPYDQALELKEIGFSEPCTQGYLEDTDNVVLMFPAGHHNSSRSPRVYKTQRHRVLAPSYHQAFKWFRDNFDLNGWISFNPETRKYSWEINTDLSINDWDTHEDAELYCLQKLIIEANKQG